MRQAQASFYVGLELCIESSTHEKHQYEKTILNQSLLQTRLKASRLSGIG